VFVRQTLGFENPKYPNRVYKLSKALYGLKQASWAWYASLKTFLLEHGYVMGSVDKTLFTLNHGTDFLLVQIYMDDIIFGGSSDEDITSMDTTSPIHWSWSSTYFWTVGKHLLATVVTASYEFQFGCSTTPWKDHQVYIEMNLASCGYLIRVGHNH
jgi:hypothetical protein